MFAMQFSLGFQSLMERGSISRYILVLLWIASRTYGLPLEESQISLSSIPSFKDGIVAKSASIIAAKSSVLDNINRAIQVPKVYPDFKQYGRQEAVLEQEYWLSKKDSLYNKGQGYAARYLGLKPIVDTIQEHEKYGNDGEQHRTIAKAIVNGFDSVGNVVNSLVDLPFRAKENVGRTINAALDVVGSKLVGL